MATVKMEEIERDLLGYLRRAEAGETLLVTRADRPVIEIKPVTSEDEGQGRSPRPFGLCAGEFTVPDDFDWPLPEDILAAFEGR